MSLWLLPPESYKPYTALSKLTTTSFPQSNNFPQSPGFAPHITLCSAIPHSTTPILTSLDLSSLSPPEVEFGELAHGNQYFKFIYLKVKKTETLLGLAKYVREALLQDSQGFKEDLYDPHVSLVYSSEEPTEKRVEYVAWKTAVAIGESKGWKGGRIVLVDTRSKDVGEWKVKEQWSFPGND